MVTKSGTYDGTFRYLYDRQKIIEVRNGSGQVVQQFLHGTQYIDELIMVRVKDKGDLYVHQDANWNVIGTTDLGRHVVEHNFLSPYGELTVNQETGFGDRDGDGDVDSTDKGTVGTTCTGTVSGACRILDLDFDGDYDSTDATKFDALPQGYMVRPGLAATATSQPFAHQGLLFEPEIASYQNRARQYDPSKRRFVQRDPLGFIDSQNAYQRLNSSPTCHLDPSGKYLVVETPFRATPLPLDIVFFLRALREICPECGIQVDAMGWVTVTASPTEDVGQWLAGVINNPNITIRLIFDPNSSGSFNPSSLEIKMGKPALVDGPYCSDCVPNDPDATLVHELTHCPPLTPPYLDGDSDSPVDHENRYRRSRNRRVRSGCDHSPPHSCCSQSPCTCG